MFADIPPRRPDIWFPDDEEAQRLVCQPTRAPWHI